MISKIKHIDTLIAARLPNDGFAIVHSAWLTIMGVRQNGDLDLIISSTLRTAMFPNEDSSQTVGLPGPLERRIRFQPANSPYGGFYGADGIDDIIEKHTVLIDGLRFIEPRFYFMYKKQRMAKLCIQKCVTPLWQRSFGLPIGMNKVLNRKIRKDQRDFALINNFLDQGQNKRSDFSNVSDAAWGLPNREWLPR